MTIVAPARRSVRASKVIAASARTRPTLAWPSWSTPQRSASCSHEHEAPAADVRGVARRRGRLEAGSGVAHRHPHRVALDADAQLHRLARVEPGVADAVGHELGDHQHDVAEDGAEVAVEPGDSIARHLRGVRLGRELECDEWLEPGSSGRSRAYRRLLRTPIAAARLRAASRQTSSPGAGE